MQGFNMGRYIPPSVLDSALSASPSSNPSTSTTTPSLNGPHSNKPHPLGSRARKLASQGILVVRFEMPFAVWCAHCPSPTLIGQGVRFNAEKRRTGEMYHSTPVWAFTMRHAVCGGVIEIRTDPKAAEYVVVSGGRRRDYGGSGSGSQGQGREGGGEAEDESLVNLGPGVGVGDAGIATARERAEQRASAFGALEKTIADREQAARAGERLGELQDAADRQWDDPYAQNQRLRGAFRVGRHAREKAAAKAGEIKERMGLGIELLPETEEDARRAKLVDFGGVDGNGDSGVHRALARPLFDKGAAAGEERKKRGKDGTASTQPGKKKLKSEIAASRTRESLVSEIVSNTRAARDPFLDFGSRENTPKKPVRLPGLKRKRAAEEAPESPGPTAVGEKDAPNAAAGSTALVSYDSDSD